MLALRGKQKQHPAAAVTWF